MSDGRQYLSKSERDAILKDQGGVCCVEGCENTGPFIAEHSNPNYYKPGKPDQLMCLACEKIKTRKDKADIAHTKRLNGEELNQTERRRLRDRPLIPSRPMRSTKDQFR